eukprot:87200-Pyramimonas_sp.AAC.1
MTYHQFLERAALCFNLPREELARPGNFTFRQELLESRPPYHKAAWAVFFAMHSFEWVVASDMNPGVRRVDLSHKLRNAQFPVFSTDFQYQAVQEAGGVTPGYTPADIALRGRTKTELIADMCGVDGCGRFTVSHALLLLSGCRSSNLAKL